MDFVQLDLAFAGRITGTRRITQLADRHHIPVRNMGESSGLAVESGTLTVPDGPGLGVTLDDEFLRSFLADGETYWA